MNAPELPKVTGKTLFIRNELYTAALARAEKAEAERDEARRRRDEWKKKAEGFDAVCTALREKVGAPWPPHLSRVMWAGLAAAEKARADRAEALLKEAVEVLRFYADEGLDGYDIQVTDYGLSTQDGHIIKDGGDIARATLAKIKEAKDNG
jgi:hypothetical protein